MIWLLAALIGALTPGVALAETRALLVGVSDYDDSLAIPDLAGPPNDVRLLAAVLTARGVADITLLSDGIEGAGAPTHDAIVAGFEALAARSGAGDLVMIHLSGHGTQAIDVDGDEADGLDEVFLPKDSAPGPAGSGRIANALVDDEIGGLLDAIRATGADVWLVMDACHSGSGMRALGETAVARYVDPVVFGIATTGARETPGAAPLETPGTDLPGGLIAFYAAQSNERAYEIDLGGAGAPESYGLFSAKLAARLQSGAAMSYRQLFQAVLSDINAAPGSASLRAQTPMWEGNMGAAPVLGQGGAPVAQFAVEGARLRAGLVHGLTSGTLLALVADAAADETGVLGLAQIEAVEPTTAALRTVAENCVPEAGALCVETGPLPEVARFARLVARPVDQVLRLAPPRDPATGAPLAATDPLMQALVAAVDEVNAAGEVQLRLDPDENAVEILAAGGALHFGAPARIGATPTGPRWQPGDPPLAALLTRIARAERVAAMLGAIAGGGTGVNRTPVELAVTSRPVPAETLAHPGDFASIFEECGTALAGAGDPVALDPGARLKPCEQVHVAASAARDGTFDVNRIYIDAQYCVSVAQERIEGRAPATGDIAEDITLCNDRCPGGPQPGGQERLFLVVTKARAQAEPVNLTGLLETCPDAGARDIAGLASQLFVALTQGPGTRSLRGAPKEVWVEGWRWWNMPRAELAPGGGR